MIYLKLNRDMSLSVTQSQTIYRGENLRDKMILLLPQTIGNITVANANVYLTYIRADSEGQVALLEALPDLYNLQYYQYVFPISNTFTKYPGQVTMWLQIMSGKKNEPTVAKSGEVTMYVHESKSSDGFVEDRDITMLNQLVNKVEEKLEDYQTALNKKADKLVYNATANALQLMSGETPIGDPVSDCVCKTVDGVEYNDSNDTIQLLSGTDKVGVPIPIKHNQTPLPSVYVTGAVRNTDGEIVLTFSDGTEQNIGSLVANNINTI